MKTLQRLKLKDKTLVYLTSDQGPHLEEISIHGEVHRGYSGIYKGRESTVYIRGKSIMGRTAMFVEGSYTSEGGKWLVEQPCL